MENIKKSGKESQIHVIEGDATIELSKIKGSFDMISVKNFDESSIL